jgi:hypothetical protein
LVITVLALAASMSRKLLLHQLRAPPTAARMPSVSGGWKECFQFVHAFAHQEQPGEGVAFPDRQRQRDQAEAVAQRAFVAGRAQVDRDHRAHFDAVTVSPFCFR